MFKAVESHVKCCVESTKRDRNSLQRSSKRCCHIKVGIIGLIDLSPNESLTTCAALQMFVLWVWVGNLSPTWPSHIFDLQILL